MLENFIFENHLGMRFEGLPNGVYLKANELRNYAWDYEAINNRISRFFHSINQRKLPLARCCASKEEADEVKNRLLDVAEADIVAVLPGRIYVGDYYTTGYITESKKSNYRITGRYCNVDLVLTSEKRTWNRETLYVFNGKTMTGPDGGTAVAGLDYPYDYAYDYTTATVTRQIASDSVRSSNFRILIYGEATDPAIMINGHVYRVYGRIKPGETLLIDSLNKTIVLTTATGSKVNWFANRDRQSYIFEPIPAGMSSLLYNGEFKFDLTVIEERSEPKWI